jgi:hypothetical protein
MKTNKITSLASKSIVGALALTLVFGAPFAVMAQDKKGNDGGPGKTENNGNHYGWGQFWNRTPFGFFNRNGDSKGANRISTTSAARLIIKPSVRPAGTGISIDGLSAPTVLKVGDTGTWTIRAHNANNDPMSYRVLWGDEASGAPVMMADTMPSFAQTTTFTHAYSNPGVYTVKFTAKDETTGQTNSSSVTVYVIGERPASNAPVIKSVTGPDSLTTGTQGTWTVNAYDPQNGSLNYSIDWGDSSLPIALDASRMIVTTQTSTFTHTYSSSGTYNIKFTVKDDQGLKATYSKKVSVTDGTPTATTTPIAITNVIALVGSSSVTLKWNTNLSTDSEVYYSTTSPVVIGNASTTAVTDPALVTSHSVNVGSLATSTTYYFIVQSKDASSNIQNTGQFSLTTGM